MNDCIHELELTLSVLESIWETNLHEPGATGICNQFISRVGRYPEYEAITRTFRYIGHVARTKNAKWLSSSNEYPVPASREDRTKEAARIAYNEARSSTQMWGGNYGALRWAYLGELIKETKLRIDEEESQYFASNCLQPKQTSQP